MTMATITEDETPSKGEAASIDGCPLLSYWPPPRKAAAVRFPCIERPARYVLRCNGHYLRGPNREGRSCVARKKRSERDEWRIVRDEDDGSALTIRNHKLGGAALSSVAADRGEGGAKSVGVTCVATEDGSGREGGGGPASARPVSDDGEDDAVVPSGSCAVDRDDLKWSFVRCSDDNGGSGVVIQCLNTGDFLGISDLGEIVFCGVEAGAAMPLTITWETECVTGELCFLSNPSVDARLRCGMAGILTLSPNWKGWEVLRIIEANDENGDNGDATTTGDNDSDNVGGYVKISSWMHSQWFLCSDAQGNLTTCSHAESFCSVSVAASEGKGAEDQQPFRCSKWAIERYSLDDEGKHDGVTVRSVTHGRLLSIGDGFLRTYASLESPGGGASGQNNTNGSNTSSTIQGNHDIVNLRKSRRSQWWKKGLTKVQRTIGDSALQRRNSKMLRQRAIDAATADATLEGGNEEEEATASLSFAAVPEEDTTVWQLEAAHLQTYYFITSHDENGDGGENGSNKPKSIGSFPNVTNNLRKSDRIQLVHNDNDDINTAKIFLAERKSYVTCSFEGSITLAKDKEDRGTDWIVEEGQGHTNAFRSKPHNLYLSYKEVEEREEGGQTAEGDVDDNNGASKGLKGAFENLKIPETMKQHQLLSRQNSRKSTLCAVSLDNPAAKPSRLWTLKPCTPRAVSSRRLRTFAIGTSVAVGTTVAMPFALAGVAVVMGAIGAQAGIGFGIAAAGLTGAEALASVGAIGATAYICFMPETNSLAKGEGDPGARRPRRNAWSKRPFSNWRNW